MMMQEHLIDQANPAPLRSGPLSSMTAMVGNEHHHHQQFQHPRYDLHDPRDIRHENSISGGSAASSTSASDSASSLIHWNLGHPPIVGPHVVPQPGGGLLDQPPPPQQHPDQHLLGKIDQPFPAEIGHHHHFPHLHQPLERPLTPPKQTKKTKNHHNNNNDMLTDDLSPVSNGGGGGGGASKKSSSRRNAWGNLSYADLITQAIKSSPEQRLTLSQVYEWMVANIPYFKDKGDSNSSAGWKNSIRHNLSLHSRFVRVQNEGTGKSSWWMLNPDAKPGTGKSSRRRTPSMEGGSTAGGNNVAGNVNGRGGSDFKKRGRNKKSQMPGFGLGRKGEAASRPAMYDIPGSPKHHLAQFPFAPSDLKNQIPAYQEFPGRISPSRGIGVHPEAGFPPFTPGQEPWQPPEYQNCGPVPEYFPGGCPPPRHYVEQQPCSEGDFTPNHRPVSPTLFRGQNGYSPYPGFQAEGFSHFEGNKQSSPLNMQPHLGQDRQQYSNQVMSPAGCAPPQSPRDSRNFMNEKADQRPVHSSYLSEIKQEDCSVTNGNSEEKASILERALVKEEPSDLTAAAAAAGSSQESWNTPQQTSSQSFDESSGIGQATNYIQQFPTNQSDSHHQDSQSPVPNGQYGGQPDPGNMANWMR